MMSLTQYTGFKKAFSLVELSIVLVILGLLTGGILAGQSLIRASELRSVSAAFQQYNTAVNSFRDRYFAFPGDMPNATKFWGFAAGTTGLDNTCYDVFKTTAATCNGDGNGYINGLAIGGTHVHAERFLAWQHLANAGLVEGLYTGRTNDNATVFTFAIGRNVPASKLSNGFFDFWGDLRSSPHAYAEQSTLDNIVSIYANTSTYSILKPEEAWNIDVKLDDGKPGYGKVFSYKKTSTVGTDCTTSDTTSSAEYAISDSRILCVLSLKLQ